MRRIGQKELPGELQEKFLKAINNNKQTLGKSKQSRIVVDEVLPDNLLKNYKKEMIPRKRPSKIPRINPRVNYVVLKEDSGRARYETN